MTFIRGSSRPFLAMAFSAVFYYCSFEFMDQALFSYQHSSFSFCIQPNSNSQRFFVAAALFSAIAAYDLVIYAMSDKQVAAPVNVELKEMVTIHQEPFLFLLFLKTPTAPIVMVTIFSALTAMESLKL